MSIVRAVLTGQHIITSSSLLSIFGTGTVVSISFKLIFFCYFDVERNIECGWQRLRIVLQCDAIVCGRILFLLRNLSEESEAVAEASESTASVQGIVESSQAVVESESSAEAVVKSEAIVEPPAAESPPATLTGNVSV